MRRLPARFTAAGLVPAALLAALAVHAPLAAPAAPIRPNDHRQAAGRLVGGVLTLRLEVRDGLWYPEGRQGVARPVAAFGEQGGPLQNPGPLIRVPAGTEVRVSVRNRLALPLTLHGLGAQRGAGADSVRLAPGEARELRFRAQTPGTYWYAGRTAPAPRLFGRNRADSQLNGVIVVDAPGAARPPRDRIFLISGWGGADSTAVSGIHPHTVLAINGRSWPFTERFDVVQGDSLHWRWVSMTALAHPMHLHGFYFRVDGRGNGATYTRYTPEQRRQAVTEVLRSGESMEIAWSPSRPGNWIFHCHVTRHMTPTAEIDRLALRRAWGPGGPPLKPLTPHAGHMAKLVLGIRVAPRGGVAAQPAGAARPVRLVIRSRPGAPGGFPSYAYVLGGSPQEHDTAALPAVGPTLLLERGQPVAVTVVNRSHEPAAVHWHGIELESFPDGVPGWSGEGSRLLPVISPGDSLTVRFTPPRAGTFMYHSHFNEHQQIASGLRGAIVVLEPGQRFDPDTDRVLLLSDAAPSPNLLAGPIAPVLLNGQPQPQPLELRAGTTYRLRFISIRSDLAVTTTLLAAGRPVLWRAVAKDGAELPPAQATLQPALLEQGPGEVHDFEFTPAAPGELVLRFAFPAAPPIPRGLAPPTEVAVRVR